jgi:hypothetical protein
VKWSKTVICVVFGLTLGTTGLGAATKTGGVVLTWGCVGRPGVSSGNYGQCSVPR